MEWMLFTYSVPGEPSRKRVFIWRSLKKLGALSLDGTGWFLPKREGLSTNIADIASKVEEMGGTANIYMVTDFDEEQERRTIAHFQEERKQEYASLVAWCRTMMQHAETQTRKQKFSFEEVEELEQDLDKLNRWFSEIKERDFWEAPERQETEKLIGEAEASVAAFTQKAYEWLRETQQEKPA